MSSALDTIFAVATAPGKAGVAVIRVSGPLAHDALARLTRQDVPHIRQLARRNLYDGELLLDEALVVLFSKSASFTGEPVAELHVHGSIAVQKACLDALGRIDGLRLAEPGEFTRRALDHGRLDLVQVEALADLIDAETEAQRRQALAAVGGELSKTTETLRSTLVEALALLTASLDFPDEEDAPSEVADDVDVRVTDVLASLEKLLSGVGTAERIREGFRVALVGAPNVGKSTLLNALVRREASITSPYAGTTRDVVEVACDINGIPVLFQDLAGIREAVDPVETIGVERALAKVKSADLRIALESKDAPLGEIRDVLEDGDILVWTKSDLFPGDGLSISALNGGGLEALSGKISNALSHRISGSELVARERQVKGLQRAKLQLVECRNCSSPELQAEHIRLALEALDFLLGRVGVEDVLDELFSRFCMGK